MGRLEPVTRELIRHAPFTAMGAVTGIAIMAIIELVNAPREISNALFYTLHPLHIVLSALVTTAMYKLYGRGKLPLLIIIG